MAWGALDDVVMGGVSESTFQIDRNGGENGGPTGLFKGLLYSNFRTFVCVAFLVVIQTLYLDAFS